MTLRYLAAASRRSLRERGMGGTWLLARKYVGDRWFAFEPDQTERRFRLSQRLNAHFDCTVAYGPFTGLRLSEAGWWGGADRGAMLLGLYEQEVLAWLERHAPGRKVLVDIGAADGYYAVGALVAGWVEHCVCFETSDTGRTAILANAKANGVADRITVLGHADEAALAALVEERRWLGAEMLMLVDIEGAEFAMLTQPVLDVLQEAAIVVELHEWEVEAGEIEALVDRCRARFDVGWLVTGSRDLSPFPELASWPDDDRWLLCSESRRQLMRWMTLEPRGEWEPSGD